MTPVVTRIALALLTLAAVACSTTPNTQVADASVLTAGNDTEDNGGGAVKPDRAAGNNVAVVGTAPVQTPAATPAARTGCQLVVATKGANAVGQPCLTSEAFMRSLGLTDAEIAQVKQIQVGRAAH